MRLLYLARHAAARDDAGSGDFDRPLSRSGAAQARLVGLRLRERIKTLDLVLSSPAARAVRTAEAFRRAFDLPRDGLMTADFLYGEWDFDRLRKRLVKAGDPASVLVVGHNPVLTARARELAGDFQDELAKASVLACRWGARSFDRTEARTAELLFHLEPGAEFAAYRELRDGAAETLRRTLGGQLTERGMSAREIVEFMEERAHRFALRAVGRAFFP